MSAPWWKHVEAQCVFDAVNTCCLGGGRMSRLFVEGSFIKEHHLWALWRHCENLERIIHEPCLHEIIITSMAFSDSDSYDHLFLMYFSLWRRMQISGVNPSLTGSQLTTSTPPFYTPPHSLKLPPATRYKIPREAISTASLREWDRLTESFWLNWQLMTSAWLSHLENADGKRFHPGVNTLLIGHACRREGGGLHLKPISLLDSFKLTWARSKQCKFSFLVTSHSPRITRALKLTHALPCSW